MKKQPKLLNRFQRGDSFRFFNFYQFYFSKGREALCQTIARNVFNQNHITQLEETGKVLYRSKLQKDKENAKQNFKVYDAEECIAALTQHIPDKHFQMVRYYGWYSNKSKGLRRKDVEEKRREKK